MAGAIEARRLLDPPVGARPWAVFAASTWLTDLRRFSTIVSKPASVIECRLLRVTIGLSIAIFIVGSGIADLGMWTNSDPSSTRVE